MGDWTDPHADNLAIRAASAALLILVGLGAVWAGGPFLAAATAAAAVAMSFEWARMSEPKTASHGFAVGGVAALAAVSAASLGAIALAGAIALIAMLLSAIRSPSWRAGVTAAFGVAYICAPSVGFVWLREQPDGLAILLSLFGIVWATDSAAYFAGRFIGGPLLAPSLSPKKTWAGVAAGAAGGCGAGAILAALHQGPLAAWVAVGGGFALVGLAGDLFESLCKRQFGVKDASNLIPGHGGVLDRLDSLLAVTSVALAAALLAPDLTARMFGPNA